jgi:hypothetical protein
MLTRQIFCLSEGALERTDLAEVGHRDSLHERRVGSKTLGRFAPSHGVALRQAMKPSGFVQSMIAELIIGPQSPQDGDKGGNKDGRRWKTDGWVRWLEGAGRPNERQTRGGAKRAGGGSREGGEGELRK